MYKYFMVNHILNIVEKDDVLDFLEKMPPWSATVVEVQETNLYKTPCDGVVFYKK